MCQTLMINSFISETSKYGFPQSYHQTKHLFCPSLYPSHTYASSQPLRNTLYKVEQKHPKRHFQPSFLRPLDTFSAPF